MTGPRYLYPDAVVSTQWLADNLSDPTLRIFDCTTYLHYETGTGRPYTVVSGRADYERGLAKLKSVAETPPEAEEE